MTAIGVSVEQARAALAEKILGDEFSCVAGKTAWQQSVVVHHHLGLLAGPGSAAQLHPLLVDFARYLNERETLLASFAVTFTEPAQMSEERFEELLWEQLQQVHEIDAAAGCAWDPAADRDPASPHFAYSIGGHAFFVVGLHSTASRTTRRFPLPTLVFNSHRQFERLKERGMYQRIQKQVRQREMALQGSLNPNLSDFGNDSEAGQYSGRAVEPDWRCPFRPETGGTR
jgi:FPC/CPF motif-containing protein YcgG